MLIFLQPELSEHIPICEKLKDPVFAACHPLIDVDIYVDACNFDATHSGDNQASFCKTAMEYGRQCCQIGISIENWPSDLECGKYLFLFMEESYFIIKQLGIVKNCFNRGFLTPEWITFN